MIDSLDNETQASTGMGESPQLETAREYLQQLLRDDGLTKFNFKIPPTLRSDPPPKQDSQPLSRSQLGPFAKLVLDSSDVKYCCSDSTTCSSKPHPRRSKGFPTPTSSSKPLSPIIKDSSRQNSLSSTPQSKKLPKPIVLIPRLSPSSNIDDVQYIADPSSPKRRKIDSQMEERQDAVQLRDQKEVSDAALVKLQSLLHEIFEAEDHLLPDDSPEALLNNKFFKTPNSISEIGPVLASDIHGQLSKALQKVTDYRRLEDVPSEYIKRIQKICEAPIMVAQSAEFRLESPPSDAETERWVHRLEDVQNILLAITTLLQTMSGNQSTKGLCPEDLIQAIPTSLGQIFDHCIIPVVECRASGKDSTLFSVFTSKKQIISNVIHQTKKVLTRLASFLSNVDLAEGPITAMEFLAARLIFVENAPNDKESAVGVQKYEASRRAAMDVLAKIFAKYPNQRPFILDEILVSLEKLPSNRQSARQFKLIDGKSIQLLSALVIQLVQTTALQLSTRPTLDQNALQKSSNISRTDDLDGSEEEADTEDSDDEKKHKTTAIKRLSKQIDPLYDNAIHSAQYVTKFIVQRAMTSTKTGDQPYRNLLDLFTEDLITVLGSTDWPGAELILRVLASQMITIADHDKSTANAKNMSLELLGWMGSAISDLTSAAQHLSNAIEDGEGDLTEQLRYWLDEHSNRALHIQDIIGLDGPYRMALEFLEQRNLGDWQLSSARGYLVAQWAKIVCSGYEESVQNGAGNAQGVRTLAKTLNHILSGPKWLESNSIFERISTQQARLAYFIIILSSGFCKGFDTIVKVLLSSITSDQAKVRSRSLKSVIQMLERDSGLLDRDESIMALILRSATDSSPMVRDSALGLIAKCMFLKPSLEENCCCAILASSSDQTVGVRKRCITLMKDIYPQTSTHELKLAIIEQLLQRVNDFETTVAGQARLALEDIWFSPLHSSSAGSVQTTPQSKVTLENLMDLIVGTVRGNECVIPAFEAFIKHELSTESKSASSNFAVCKAVVSTMFDRIVHGSENIDKRTLQSLLQSITVFAKANAKLFTPDQLETLHPYIGHLSNADDLILFRSVVVIYRCVLPYLSTSHNTLLKDIQNDLFKSVSKLPRTELNEVMACLWTINGVLQNTERLVKLTISVLKGINQAASINSDSSINADALGRVRSYIRIAGCVGKHCDLESFQSFFSHAFPQMKSTSVAGLIVDFISPFASSKYTQELRIMALESLGAVCETWPAQYGREPARTAFTSVFKEDSADLQNIVLKGFLAFFSIHEGKAEKLIETAGVDADGDATRLGGSLKASENDGAAALIAQHFLQQMLHAALSKENSHALTAIELIASVNRQGLIHPKECAGVLVALETSSNTKISSIAFETHKMLHQQHESMFDREYMRAVQEAFYYQRDIVGDPAGALTRPFTAKLAPLFEIIKISNSRYQKKFLTNLCSKVDFEPRKLDINGNPPEQLLLARFVCQNLAFFEYAQIGELLATVTCMERIVASTGTTVAHAIETDIFPVKFENTEHQVQVDNSTAPEREPQHIDPDTLKQLATAAAALSLLWETRSYLRRLYGISFHSLPKESKAGAKELNKSVSKVQGVSSERLWDAMAKTMACLENAEGMITICREFATLMAIDDELKVTADDDRNGYDSTTELVDVGTIIAPSNGSKLGKRRSSVSSGNAPKRPKQKGKGKNAKKRGSTGSDNDAVLD
ncbi:Sister chromatid cohesion protein 2 [Ophidiomyces ophidiicola]|nr:Sister chromatid cohesion protein 2 [Ophidiomyces ophidiicola]KAI1985227.1 Sister chromatid cohesion protein 2 [Ophidiomyces ophidiicola]KAI1990642.1 Sister chromatid cohesion protein 2 [Ophidiomyces ophidiicola]